MIDHKTPGAYTIDKGGRNRGYAGHITKEKVEALRAQGLPWAAVATALGVSYSALHSKWYRWKQQESKAPQDGAEGD